MFQAQPSIHLCLPILFENEHLLVLNKSSGVPSQPLKSTETETAVGFALKHGLTLQNAQGMAASEPGLVHRLDIGTSGCLIFAKTQETFEFLKKHWTSGIFKKTYQSLCVYREQVPFEQTPFHQRPLILKDWMGHDSKSSKKMRWGGEVVASKSHPALAPKNFLRSIRGKPRMAWSELSWIRFQKLGELYAVEFEIFLKTGLRHQIRVQLAARGFPICGDLLYQKEQMRSHISQHPFFQKLQAIRPFAWLHACSIRLPPKPQAPQSEWVLIKAPLPNEWANWNSSSF